MPGINAFVRNRVKALSTEDDTKSLVINENGIKRSFARNRFFLPTKSVQIVVPIKVRTIELRYSYTQKKKCILI